MSLSYARPILYDEWMAPEVFITADLLFWRGRGSARFLVYALCVDLIGRHVLMPTYTISFSFREADSKCLEVTTRKIKVGITV